MLLAAGGELIVSDISPYRFFPQYWRLIRNDPDTLIFCFSSNYDCSWPERPGVVVFDKARKLHSPTKHAVVVQSLAITHWEMVFQVRFSAWTTFDKFLNVSINDHWKYQTLVSIFKLTNKMKHLIVLKLEIILPIHFTWLPLLFYFFNLLAHLNTDHNWLSSPTKPLKYTYSIWRLSEQIFVKSHVVRRFRTYCL